MNACTQSRRDLATPRGFSVLTYQGAVSSTLHLHMQVSISCSLLSWGTQHPAEQALLPADQGRAKALPLLAAPAPCRQQPASTQALPADGRAGKESRARCILFLSPRGSHAQRGGICLQLHTSFNPQALFLAVLLLRDLSLGRATRVSAPVCCFLEVFSLCFSPRQSPGTWVRSQGAPSHVLRDNPRL